MAVINCIKLSYVMELDIYALLSRYVIGRYYNLIVYLHLEGNHIQILSVYTIYVDASAFSSE